MFIIFKCLQSYNPVILAKIIYKIKYSKICSYFMSVKKDISIVKIPAEK